MRNRKVWTAWCALVLAAGGTVAAGCSGGPHVEAAADAAPTPRQVGELRALERPVVRHLKLAFIAIAERSSASAARQLERAVDAGDAVTEWLDGHQAFVEANRASLECADHSLRDLREQVERDTPWLRRSLPAARERTLRIQIAETVNCIQSSD